jgi:hypothetical protein
MAAQMDCIVPAWMLGALRRPSDNAGRFSAMCFKRFATPPFGHMAMFDVDAAGLLSHPGLNFRSVREIRFEDEPQVNRPSPPAATSTI